MAATPKDPPKRRLDAFYIDKNTYDDFIRNCNKKGYAPQGVFEKLMRKFNETGQM